MPFDELELVPQDEVGRSYRLDLKVTSLGIYKTYKCLKIPRRLELDLRGISPDPADTCVCVGTRRLRSLSADSPLSYATLSLRY